MLPNTRTNYRHDKLNHDNVQYTRKDSVTFLNFPLSFLRFLIISSFWPPNYIEEKKKAVSGQWTGGCCLVGDEISSLAVNHPQNRVHAAKVKITTGDVNHLPCTGGCCLRISTGDTATVTAQCHEPPGLLWHTDGTWNPDSLSVKSKETSCRTPTAVLFTMLCHVHRLRTGYELSKQAECVKTVCSKSSGVRGTDQIAIRKSSLVGILFCCWHQPAR